MPVEGQHPKSEPDAEREQGASERPGPEAARPLIARHTQQRRSGRGRGAACGGGSGREGAAASGGRGTRGGELALERTYLPAQRRDFGLACGEARSQRLVGAEVAGTDPAVPAVREAHVNAKLNDVTERTRFLSGRVEAVLARSEGKAALQAADVVFLDPPRKGSDPHTLDALAAAKTPQIWYLSCNPATLARDLAHLRDGGYRIATVQPYDLFPQTGHVETLAVMTLAREPEPA